MPKRYFIFTWSKMNEFIQRHNKITVSKPIGDIGYDAKNALNIFIANFGNLNKINIISIQEVNEEDLPIGEPITPSESAVVPTARKRVR